MSNDRTAIITGASSGIGRAIAERLGADGIRLGLLGRDPERLAGTAAATRAVATELADVTDRRALTAGTRFFGEGDQSERRARFAGLIPSGRVGEPADIAAVVSFLCRPEADHIRGQVLHVNGGQHLAG